jgi:uncharacterized protein
MRVCPHKAISIEQDDMAQIENYREGDIWITLQSHMNTIAVASLKDLAAVLLVNGIVPTGEVIAKANDEGIVVLGTGETAFSITGKIYQLI